MAYSLEYQYKASIERHKYRYQRIPVQCGHFLAVQAIRISRSPKVTQRPTALPNQPSPSWCSVLAAIAIEMAGEQGIRRSLLFLLCFALGLLRQPYKLSQGL